MTGERKTGADLELVVLLVVVVVLVVLIILVLLGLLLGLVLLLPGLLGLLLARALVSFNFLPRLLGHLVGVLLVVGHEDVVEDRAAVHRPELEADGREVLVFRVRFRGVVLVRDERVLPGALVVRVVDHRRLPLALVVGVVDHRRLPLAVLLGVPVLGLLRLGVGNFRRDVIIPIGLDGLGVGDLLRVDPVLGFPDLGVLDLLVGEVPAVDDVALGLGVLVEEDLVGTVLLEHQSIQVRELVFIGIIEFDLVRLQQVLAVVLEDQVDARDIIAAQIRAKHNRIRSIP